MALFGLSLGMGDSFGAGRRAPGLDMNFLGNTMDPRITYTGSNGSQIDQTGVIVAATTNFHRFDHDPVTLLQRGMLFEEARTNLFLNSLVNGTVLGTQNVTVTAQPYTISFYGTGSITLSGASTGTINGTGVYPNRQTFTFTPSAGSLTCTVAGSVQFANCEAGSFATSFIPTAGATVTRTIDLASITGGSFNQWFNNPGTFYAEYDSTSYANTPSVLSFGTATGDAGMVADAAGLARWWNNTSYLATPNSIGVGQIRKEAHTFSAASRALILNAVSVVTDANVPWGTTPVAAYLGCTQAGAKSINGHLRRFSFYSNPALANTELVSATA